MIYGEETKDIVDRVNNIESTHEIDGVKNKDTAPNINKIEERYMTNRVERERTGKYVRYKV